MAFIPRPPTGLSIFQPKVQLQQAQQPVRFAGKVVDRVTVSADKVSNFADRVTNTASQGAGRVMGRVNQVVGSANKALVSAQKAANLFKDVGSALGINLGGLNSFETAAFGPYATPETKADFKKKMQARGDPLLSFEWVAFVNPVVSENDSIIDPIYIETLQTPHLSFDVHTVFREGKAKNYAGAFSCDGIAITFFTDTTAQAFQFASSWFDSVFDSKTGNYRMPSQYKRNVVCIVHDARRNALVKFTFIGCFPVSWDSYAMNGSSSEPLTTTMQLSVDHISVESGMLDNVNNDQGGPSGPKLPTSLLASGIPSFTPASARDYVKAKFF
jgi:hypothetical protein